MKFILLAARSRLDTLSTRFVYLCTLGILATSSRSVGAISATYKQASQPLKEWLLVLKNNADPEAFASTLCSDKNPLINQYNYTCTGTFRTLVKGISGRFSRAAIRHIQLQYKDSVERATRDRGLSVGDELVSDEERAQLGALLATTTTVLNPATTTATRNTTTPSTSVPANRHSAAAGRLLPEQLDPVTWGLDRIDQAALPLDHIYHYYSLGTGVNVYVLDSGVRASHLQFRVLLPSAQTKTTPASTTGSTSTTPSTVPSATFTTTTSTTEASESGPAFQPGTTSRVAMGYCALDTCQAAATGAIGSSSSGSSGSTSSSDGTGVSLTDDCYGHGTHVAALIGGLDSGVAKNVTIIPVKVLDCYGNANEATLLRKSLPACKRSTNAKRSILLPFHPAAGLQSSSFPVISSAGCSFLPVSGVNSSAVLRLLLGAPAAAPPPLFISDTGTPLTLLTGRNEQPAEDDALDWVANNLVTPAVVHMSLEGYFSAPVNAAVEELAARRNVVVVASAGNHNSDACSVSPASAQSAIAVGAIEADGTRWYKSNWGPCLDLFAPGVNLVSAVPWTYSSTGSKTGTSMAAPFVSGVAALYLQDHPGASAADVTQRLLRSSLPGGVSDDRYGAGTFTPTKLTTNSSTSVRVPWAVLDISTTPNRLLQSALTIPARLTPNVVVIQQPDAPSPYTASTHNCFVDVALLVQPTAQVNMSASVPVGWDGGPLAALTPAALYFTPEDYSAPRRAVLSPSPGGAQGDFFVQLVMRSSDYRFDFAVQDIKVVDTRPLAGETATVPRVIRRLPFRDSGSTVGFRHDYTTSEDNPLDTAPDVVYVFTPPRTMSLTVSTCGSSYDTVLLGGLGSPAGLSLDAAFANDDDPSCGSDPLSSSSSRIDVDVDGGTAVYVVVTGFNGAAGRYVLSVVCDSCADKVVEGGVAGVAVT